VDAFDAEAELLRLLRERGVDTTEVQYAHVGRGDDARDAWDAFKTLAATPLDETSTTDADGGVWRIDPDEGDMLMFEAGVDERRHPRGWRSEAEAPAWVAEVEGSKAFAAAFEHLPFGFHLLQTDY
jgi:hypothetical protein